jgi:hypothetical protein
MQIFGKAAIFGLAILLALSAASLAAEKGFLWDGSHWKGLGADLKVAYVKGVGNMADIEAATGGPGRAVCISKAFVDELKTKTVSQIVAEVDKYYQDNPGKEKMPVIEVILRASTKLCPPETPAAGAKK